MTLLLIATAWIAILALFVAACQTAARGDRQPACVLDANEHSPCLTARSWDHAPDPIRVRRPSGLPLRDGGRTRGERVLHVAR
jgi:hypothetical protein